MTTSPIVTNVPNTWTSGYFLFEPLGWTRQPLSQVITLEPDLLERLIRIDQRRMHLLALGLAHAREQITPALAWLLLEKSRKEIVETMFGYQPTGLGRILRHLPEKVLTAHTYRKLIDLLNDGVIATFLHHCPSISEATLIGLHNLPPVLRRPAIIAMGDRIDGLNRLVSGLRLLAARADVPFDQMASQIGILDQPHQIAAKLRSIVELLPLPATAPPVEIGPFRRIDGAAELRALGKAWRNCLADFVSGINDGTHAVYLSDGWQVACLLVRYGRLGWLLAQAKGPGNSDVAPDLLAQINATFGQVGAFPAADSDTIRSILFCRDWMPQHGRGPRVVYDPFF